MSKKAVSKASGCAIGEHQFIVSHWIVSQSRQTASSFICQKCLLHIEGKSELADSIRAIHGERTE